MQRNDDITLTGPGKDGTYIVAHIQRERGYFSITGEQYPTKKAYDIGNENSVISCGQITEEIEGAFPHIKPIMRLHLANVETGEPMHGPSNGWYHLSGGSMEYEIKARMDRGHKNDYRSPDDIYSVEFGDHFRAAAARALRCEVEELPLQLGSTDREAFDEWVDDVMRPRWQREADMVNLWIDTNENDIEVPADQTDEEEFEIDLDGGLHVTSSLDDEPYCAWCTDGLDQPPYCGNEGCKPMTDTATETFPGIDQIEAFYVIHSADTTRDGENTLDHMAKRVEPFLRTEDGEYGLVQTEGDEQYDFDYLADEMGSRVCTWCDGDGGSSPWESRAGYWRYSVALGGIGPITACEHCGGTGEEESCYRNGHRRKWAGLLPGDRYEEFMEAFMIDLDDSGLPERHCDTMGAMTEYGCLPAISIDDTEGWGSGWTGPNGGVIDSNIYLSIMLKEN